MIEPKDAIMKNLILDNNMLIYIHDVLALREKKQEFYQLELYKTLSEPGIITIVKDLRKTETSLITFLSLIAILKVINTGSAINILQYMFFGVISVIYGIIFVSCKEELNDLMYQVKLKRACLYALEHYEYDEYVVFLDQFLSELSTGSYVNNNI